LWDLAGKITGQPVWKLVGGNSDRVPAYASSGTLRSPAAMAETAERFRAEGFRAMKIRFHRGDWREDVAALEAVRKRLGDGLDLMVDCNQGWRMPWDTEPPWTLKDALEVARELEALDVFWMEEPLYRGDREGMRRLRDSVDVRIAGGEMTREIHEFRDLITAGALDVVQPDAALVGGITGARRIAILAEANGVVFTPHTWTNGIGLIANVHLTAGIANAPFIEFPYDPPEWSPARRDFMLENPLRTDDGVIVLDDTPGLGFDLDEAVLEQTRIG
jgi:L-alanine-DL-glutamate epimerase-like enolase superfamily enzyme